MATFLEGIDVVRQPCTLALIVPAMAVTLVARAQALGAAISFGVGASILAWAQAARYWEIRDVAPATVIAGLAAVAAVVAVSKPTRLRPDLVIGGALVAGAIAGWLWRPCVGSQLADILNHAATDQVRTFPLMLLYIAGVLLPVLLLALAPVAAPRLVGWRDSVVTLVVGVTLAVAWAGAIAFGVYDDVLSELVRRSTA